MYYGNTSYCNKYSLRTVQCRVFVWLSATSIWWFTHPDSILWLHRFHVLKIICFQLANRRRQCGEGLPYSLITLITHSTSVHIVSAHIVLVRTCQLCSHPSCKVVFGTYSCAEQLPSNHCYEKGPWILVAPALMTLYLSPDHNLRRSSRKRLWDFFPPDPLNPPAPQQLPLSNLHHSWPSLKYSG